MKGSDFTADGRTFVTRFTSDTSSYTKGINEMQSKLRSLNKDLKENQSEQKAAAKTITAAEKEISKLTTQIAKHGDEDGKLTKRIEELNRTISTERDHIEKLKISQSQIQREIGDTTDKINAQKKALDTLSKSYDDSVKYAKELAAEVGGLAASGTAALAVILKLAESAAVWADDLETMSQKTGIAVTELQKFQYASELIDVSAETVAGALNRMTLNMQTAQNSTGKQRDAFEALGVTYEDTTGKLRDRETVFYELIDALGKIENETERDALAMNIFGRSATELNPLIKGGAQQLKELGAQAEAAGLILSDNAIKGLHNFNDQMDLLKAKGSQIEKILAGQTTPAFEGLLDVADDLLDKVNELAQTGQIEEMSRKAGIYITGAAQELEKLIGFVWKYKEAIAAGAAAMVAFKMGMTIGNLVTSLIAGFQALSVATKAETADMTALNVVMDANPIGAVLGLVGALAGALVTLSVATNLGTDSFDSMKRSAENCLKSLRDAEKAAADSTADVQAQEKTISALAAEYEDLRRKVNPTAGEMKALDSVAEELAKTLGINVDELKSTSGAYRELTGDIDEYLEKLREQVRFENNKTGLTAAYTAFDAAEEKFRAAKIQLDELKAANADFEKILSDDQLKRKWEDFKYAQTSGRDSGLTLQEQELYEDISKYEQQVKSLESTLGDYQWQMSQAAAEVIKYKEALGATVDEEDEYKKLVDAMNGSTGKRTEGQEDLNEKTEEASDDVSSLSEKVKKLDEELDKTISDSLSGIEEISDTLGSIKKEVQENGSLSLSTLNSIIKKYPELTDAVNDYISGISDEKEIIKGLEDAYNDDVANYTYALNQKRLSQGQFGSDMLGKMQELVDEYKSKYNIDLTNFADVTAAKLAVQEQYLAEYRRLSNQYEVGMVDGKTIYYRISGNGSKTRLTNDSEIQAAQQALTEAWNNYSTFDPQQFANDLLQRISSATGVTPSFGGSSGSYSGGYSGGSSAGSSGGSGSSASTTWRVWNSAAQGTGNTYAGAYLDWMSKIKALGQMSTESEIRRLEELKKRTDINAEDLYKIDVQLYNARKKLADEQARETQERLSLAAEAYRKLVGDQISLQQKKAQAAKDAADKEIAAIDAVMKKRQEEKEDDRIKQELKSINNQLTYKNLDDLSRYELQKRRQELLTEQSGILFERNMNERKAQLQSGAESVQAQADAAIDKLNAAIEKAAYSFARQSGTLSNSQIVNNNSTQQNITLVQNSLSNQQMIDRLLKKLTSY